MNWENENKDKKIAALEKEKAENVTQVITSNVSEQERRFCEMKNFIKEWEQKRKASELEGDDQEDGSGGSGSSAQRKSCRVKVPPAKLS